MFNLALGPLFNGATSAWAIRNGWNVITGEKLEELNVADDVDKKFLSTLRMSPV